MKLPLIAILVTIFALGCTGDDDPRTKTVEMTTLEDVPTELKTIRKPPQIEFEQRAAPAELAEGEEPPPEQTAEAKAEAKKLDSTLWLEDLPFAPKIAMDPVDGSKVSIRQDTPIAEFKGRIYYFSTESNRMVFIKNPEEYLSGSFASY